MENFDDNAMLDPQAAENLTGLAVATLAKWRCVGGGPVFVKAGRKVLYRRADLIDWLNERRVASTTDAARLAARLTAEAA